MLEWPSKGSKGVGSFAAAPFPDVSDGEWVEVEDNSGTDDTFGSEDTDISTPEEGQIG